MTNYQDSCCLENSEQRINLILSAGVLVFGILSFIMLAVKFFPYTMDDSYITFRYSVNLFAGHGLVFNPGEYPRAEGITTPLYAVILCLAPLIGLDIVTFAKFTGLLAFLCTAVIIGILVYKVSLLLTAMGRLPAIMVSCTAAAYYLSNPYAVANAVSGMETSLAALSFSVLLLLVLRAYLLGAEMKLPGIFLTGIIAVVIPLFRPEMALSVLTLLVMSALICRAVRRQLILAALVFILLGAFYFAWRFFYYGLVFPLPFYIKQGSLGLPGLSEVNSYLVHAVVLLPFILVLTAFIWGPKNGNKNNVNLYLAAVIAVVGLQLAYYATIVHMMGFGYRYFQPVSIGLVLLAFAGGAVLYDMIMKSRLKESFSLAVLFCVVVAAAVGANIQSYQPARSLFISWYKNGLMSGIENIAYSMHAASKGEKLRIALNDCGAIPFYSGFSIVDLCGLNNRAIAIGASTEAAKKEIMGKKPHLVILISKNKHDPYSLYGSERLRHKNMMELSYKYAGTMPVGWMPNGDGYHYLVYSNGEEKTVALLEHLSQSGVIEAKVLF